MNGFIWAIFALNNNFLHNSLTIIYFNKLIMDSHGVYPHESGDDNCTGMTEQH